MYEIDFFRVFQRPWRRAPPSSAQALNEFYFTSGCVIKMFDSYFREWANGYPWPAGRSCNTAIRIGDSDFLKRLVVHRRRHFPFSGHFFLCLCAEMAVFFTSSLNSPIPQSISCKDVEIVNISGDLWVYFTACAQKWLFVSFLSKFRNHHSTWRPKFL